MNTILYCPLLDSKLVKEFVQLGKRIDDTVGFQFKSTNPWQDLIREFDFSSIPDACDFFVQKSMAGTHLDVRELQNFLKENNFTLNPSMPAKNINPRIIECLALAFMELKTTWPESYHGKVHKYKVKSNFEDKQLQIDGFTLSNTRMKIKRNPQSNEYFAVSAAVELEDNFAMTFSNVTAFAENVTEFEKLIHGPIDLYTLVNILKLDYSYDGYLICPKVDVSAQISNHLRDISLQANYPDSEIGLIERIILTASEQLSWLKLDEKGVEVRSEAYASGEILLTASAHGPQKPYFPLIIEHGLIFSIYYGKQPFFVGYIPQEKFELIK